MDGFAGRLVARLTRLTETAASVDVGLWTGRFSPETRPVAEAALARTVEKCERIRRVLRVRYGVVVP